MLLSIKKQTKTSNTYTHPGSQSQRAGQSAEADGLILTQGRSPLEGVGAWGASEGPVPWPWVVPPGRFYVEFT